MGSVQDQYFESAGVPIRFVDVGKGSPVVLIHLYMSSGEIWMRIGVMPSEQFRFIAIDCRGHGRSGKPHDTASYGTKMVVDLVNLLDLLEIKKAHFVGYSIGAEIALKLATLHPDRVRSLFIGGSGWSGEHEYEMYKQVADSLEKSGSFGPLIRGMQTGVTDEKIAEQIASADEMLQGQDVAALAAVARAMNDIINVSRDELSNIQVPVFGIAGEKDPERRNLEKMKGVVPDFTMKILVGRGHEDAILDPQYKSSIMRFLSGQQ